MVSSTLRCLQQSFFINIAVIIFLISLLFSLTGGITQMGRYNNNNNNNDLESKMRLGSRPPGCVNKCMSCRPCIATLVVPPRDRNFNSQGEDGGGYYLLSWKCRCGKKIYQP